MRMLRAVSAIPIVLALAVPASAGQISFEQATHDLTSADATTRLRAVQLLKEAAYPEAALPVALLVTDPRDDIQFEAIAAELNIFMAEKIVTRRKIGGVIEVRNAVAADAAFSAGLLVLGPRPVPPEVLTALRAGARDDNPRVALEALYAFGTLAVEPSGEGRRGVLASSGADLASMVGAPDPALRFAAVRVLGRVFAWRARDEPVEPSVGDAVIAALNDKDRAVQQAAMEALGAMRYERAVQALTELFQYYGKGDLAAASLDAVAHIAHASSLPLLTAQLASKNNVLKVIAIEGLARAGDKSKYADIQTAAAGFRGEEMLLAASFASAALAGGTLDPLAEALARSKLHDQAKGYLTELAPGRSAAYGRFLQDPDPRMRADLADALALSYDATALPAVEALLKDRDPQVVRAATRAAARLRALTN